MSARARRRLRPRRTPSRCMQRRAAFSVLCRGALTSSVYAEARMHVALCRGCVPASRSARARPRAGGACSCRCRCLALCAWTGGFPGVKACIGRLEQRPRLQMRDCQRLGFFCAADRVGPGRAGLPFALPPAARGRGALRGAAAACGGGRPGAARALHQPAPQGLLRRRPAGVSAQRAGGAGEAGGAGARLRRELGDGRSGVRPAGRALLDETLANPACAASIAASVPGATAALRAVAAPRAA